MMTLPSAVAGLFEVTWTQSHANEAVSPFIHGRKVLCFDPNSNDCPGELRAALSIAVVAITAAAAALLVCALCRFFGCCCFKNRRTEGNGKVDEDNVQVFVGSPSEGPPSPVHTELMSPYVYGDIPKELSLAEVKIQSILGRGQFGKVYKGNLHGVGVAVKMIQHESSLLKQYGEPFEALLSRTVDHPNIVKTYWYQTTKHQDSPQEGLLSPAELFTGHSCGTPQPDQWLSASHRHNLSEVDFFDYLSPIVKGNGQNGEVTFRTWIVMEFCNRGSLYNAINDGFFFVDRKKRIPRFSSVLCTALDIAQALKYLHSGGIIHGDLKSQNVLLQSSKADTRGFYCKIGDFGLSRVLPDNSYLETFTCGTVRYMPPELLKDGVLTPAADVYSMGLVLWELITGQQPYPKACQKDIIMDVVDGRRPPLPVQCPADISSLIRDCWHNDYRKRPTSKQLVECVNFLRVVYTPAARFPVKHISIERRVEVQKLRSSSGLSSSFRTNSFGASSSQSSNSLKALLPETQTAGHKCPKHRLQH